MMKRLDCKVNDENIYGVVYIPDTDRDKYPTIIFCHGFCMTHSYFTSYAEELIKHDIACYLFDFRGGLDNNRSSGNLLNTSVLTENEDLRHVTEMIGNMDFADNNRLYLVGHSQGGFGSALISSQYPDIFKSIFLMAPAFVIPDEMREVELPEEGEISGISAGFISRKYVLDARSIDIFDEIVNYRGNVCIFHGTNDSIVPIRYSKRAVQVYTNAKLSIMSNEGHMLSDKHSRKVVLDKILDVVNGG